MKSRDLDEYVRQLYPPAEIPAERVDAVIASVLGRTSELRRPASAGLAATWRPLVAALARFAVPMAAAAALALVVGRYIHPAETSVRLADMLVASSTLISTGY